MATRKKSAPKADAWLKEVALSTELRRWFAHRVTLGEPHALEAACAALARMCARSGPPHEEAAIHDGRT